MLPPEKGHVSEKESLNKAASAPQSASQSLMRPESRESERSLFRASKRYRPWICESSQSSTIKNRPVGEMKNRPTPAANAYEPDKTSTSFVRQACLPIYVYTSHLLRHIFVPASSDAFPATKRTLPGWSRVVVEGACLSVSAIPWCAPRHALPRPGWGRFGKFCGSLSAVP